MKRKKIFWGSAALAGILGICLASFLYSRTRTAEGSRLLENGRVAFSSGAYEEAVVAFTKALHITPPTGQIYAERAAAYQKKGEEAKALEDYNAAIRLGGNAKVYAERGAIFFQRSDWEKASADLAEAIRRGAVEANLLIKHARSRAALQDVDTAIASLDKVLAIEAQNSEAREFRGDLYFKKGDLDKAMEDYADLRSSRGESVALQRKRQVAAESAKAVAPQKFTEANALFEKARRAAEGGRFEEAVQFYNALLQMDLPLPLASTACQNRGNAYGALNNDEAALRDYEQAIRFDPTNPGAYVNRGFILATRGDHDAAIMDYKEAIRFDPKLHQAFFNRALSYREEGDLDSALRDLTEAIRLRADFALAYVNRGAVYQTQRKLDRASSDYEAALKIDPALPEAYLGRARVFLQKKSFSRAAADLEKAVELRPESAGALNSLAWIRATSPPKVIRDGKKAVATALQACTLTNWGNFACVDTLAAAYAEQGDFEKAVNFQWYALTLETPESEDANGVAERLRLYQQRRPYRETEVVVQ